MSKQYIDSIMHGATMKDMLTRVFQRNLEEIKGDWRKLRNEKRYDVSSSPHMIRMIKERLTKWAGNVTRIGKERMTYKFGVGKFCLLLHIIERLAVCSLETLALPNHNTKHHNPKCHNMKRVVEVH